MDTRSLGVWGEQEAARYLQLRGLRIVDRHYQKKWGELDLICRDGDTWVFVEVKARESIHEPAAVDSITPRKRERLIRAAMSYMKAKGLSGSSMRFDLILIEDGRLLWIPDAFEIPNRYTC